MYDELLRCLRGHSEKYGCAYNCICDDASKRGFGTCSEELAKLAADAIEELSRKTQDLPRWIPVTERLPNCNGCYLVWRPHFFGGKIGMPSICYFDGSDTWHDSYGVDFERILHQNDVTHWMPLPQPPKDGEA